jgi:hypothetical protein
MMRAIRVKIVSFFIGFQISDFIFLLPLAFGYWLLAAIMEWVVPNHASELPIAKGQKP